MPSEQHVTLVNTLAGPSSSSYAIHAKPVVAESASSIPMTGENLRPPAYTANAMADVGPSAKAKESSPSPDSASATVSDFLASLNLSEYYQSFLDEGFDRMSSVLEITEDDLSALKVKRGHRRTIQRQIASIKGIPYTSSLSIPPRGTGNATSGGDSEDSPPILAPASDDRKSGRIVQNNSNVIVFKGKQIAVNGDDVEERSKRRYRRHPKPDMNAPDKPPSAYVTFSNNIREELKGTKSFSEIARIVGEQWKTLDLSKKEKLEMAAARAKEQYHTALAQYKTTPDYAAHQQYLSDFRARHGQQETNKGNLASKGKASSVTPPIASASIKSPQLPPKRPSSASVTIDYSDSDSDGSIEMPSNDAFFARQREGPLAKRRRDESMLPSAPPGRSDQDFPTSAALGFTRPYGGERLSASMLPGVAATPAVSTSRSTLEDDETQDDLPLRLPQPMTPESI